jgi:hypothetical protein
MTCSTLAYLELSTKGEVAVLIDEYDRPMLEHLYEPETAKAIRTILREFYIVLKTSEPHIKFVLLTGLTKITEAGVFSSLNHLDELTTQPDFSAMLGYTQRDRHRTAESENVRARQDQWNRAKVRTISGLSSSGCPDNVLVTKLPHSTRNDMIGT